MVYDSFVNIGQDVVPLWSVFVHGLLSLVEYFHICKWTNFLRNIENNNANHFLIKGITSVAQLNELMNEKIVNNISGHFFQAFH